MSNLYTYMQECYERMADAMSELYYLEQEIHDLITNANILPEDVMLIVDAGEINVFSPVGVTPFRRYDLEEKIQAFLEEV